MNGRYMIHMVFETEKYMTFKVIYSLLDEFQLLGDGKLVFSRFGSMDYKSEELKEKLHNVNYRKMTLCLKTSNDKISVEINSPLIMTFSHLIIDCKDTEIVNHTIEMLLQFFKDDFYMIHVMNLDDEHERVYKCKDYYQLSFKQMLEGTQPSSMKKRKRRLERMIHHPFFISWEMGVNIGFSRDMYFGKKMDEFFDRETLLHCPDVYSVSEKNNVINIRLYEHLDQERDFKMEKRVKKYLKIEEVADSTRNSIYSNERYGQFFMKNHERYEPYYFYGDYLNDFQEDKEYRFRILNHDLVLKRYKNTCFKNEEEDFAAAEILGYMTYCPNSNTYDGEYLKHPDDAEAYIMINYNSDYDDLEDYVKKEGYELSVIKKGHYLLTRENDDMIEKTHCFDFPKRNIVPHSVTLVVHKHMLDEKTIKKVINEFDRMIKGAKWVKNEL